MSKRDIKIVVSDKIIQTKQFPKNLETSQNKQIIKSYSTNNVNLSNLKNEIIVQHPVMNPDRYFPNFHNFGQLN